MRSQAGAWDRGKLGPRQTWFPSSSLGTRGILSNLVPKLQLGNPRHTLLACPPPVGLLSIGGPFGHRSPVVVKGINVSRAGQAAVHSLFLGVGPAFGKQTNAQVQ